MLLNLGPQFNLAAQTSWANWNGSKDAGPVRLYDDVAWEGDHFSRSTPVGDGVFVFSNWRRATGSNVAGLVVWAIRVEADNSITVGPATVVATSDYLAWSASVSVLGMEPGIAVVMWNKAAANFDIRASTLTVGSDLTITASTPAAVVSGWTGTRIDHSHAIRLTATKILLCGRSDSNTFRVRTYGLTWNPTTKVVNPIGGTGYAVGNSLMEQGGRLVRISDTQAILAATGAAANLGLRSALITFGDTSVTTSTATWTSVPSGAWADNFNSNLYDTSIAPGAITYGMGDSTNGMRVIPMRQNGTATTNGNPVTLPGVGVGSWNPVWLSSTRLIGFTASGGVGRAFVLDHDSASNSLSVVNGPIVLANSGFAHYIESHRIDANRVLACYGGALGGQTTTLARVLSIS